MDAPKGIQKMISKRLLNKEIKKPRLKFNLGSAQIGPRTTIEYFHEKKTQDCNTYNFSDFRSKSLESLHLSQATWFIKTEFILVSPYLSNSCVSLDFSQVLLSFVRNSLTPCYARSKLHLYPLLMTSEDTLN